VPGEPDIDRIDRPDIEIGARVKAERLSFTRVPEIEIRTHGEPEHDAVSGSERTNLPDAVEPDVAYWDVEVRWRAAVRLGGRREG
jgi:hypothetical protein